MKMVSVRTKAASILVRIDDVRNKTPSIRIKTLRVQTKTSRVCTKTVRVLCKTRDVCIEAIQWNHLPTLRMEKWPSDKIGDGSKLYR